VRTSPGALEALKLPLREGRLLAVADAGQDAGLVLSETAARSLFPNSTGIGQVVDLRGVRRPVLGVVADERLGVRAGVLPPKVFEPIGREHRILPVVVVRLRGRTQNVEAMLREVAKDVGPPVFVERVRSGSEWFASYFALDRKRAMLFLMFGGVGVLLAVTGIVGVTAHAVTRRTHEIGVRIALGASPARVVAGFTRDAAWAISAGLALGLAGAATAKSVFSSLVVETSPRDLPTFFVVAVILAACGLGAALIAARTAARVDPATTLRAE
jgi:hypothetical protein